MHTLWEMNDWLEKYVKNAPPRKRRAAELFEVERRGRPAGVRCPPPS
jgi:hypothetical protein